MTIDQLIQFAEAGDCKSQYKLASMYEFGDGVEKNINTAMMWYQKSAEQGYAPAQHMMGWHAKDCTTGFKWYKLAADQGYVPAIYMVGIAYQGGKGVKEDIVEAITYFYKAAMGGETRGALYNLMAHYIQGEVPVEYQPSCLKCFLKYSNFDWVQVGLADIFQQGIGVEQDDTEAVRWYAKAAEQGYGLAIYKLGLCYEDGRGVEKDHGKARRLYEIAAQKNVRAAIKKLELFIDTSKVPSELSSLELSVRGDDYFYGRQGYIQDYKEAIKYYYKAAEKGNVIAQNDLGNCLFHGKGCITNLTQAIIWYRKAANQGYMYGQFNLAWGYEHGEGIEKNLVEAVKWYKKAAEQGHPQAQKRMELLQNAM